METGQIILMKVVAWGEVTLVDQKDLEIVQGTEAGTEAETGQGRGLRQMNLCMVWFRHSQGQGQAGEQFHADIPSEDQH